MVRQPAPKKILTPAECLVKILRYCAYQERSHLEVRNKLFSYGLHEDEVSAMIANLIMDGFLNEERFAKAFSGGKFRMKKWGKNKIVNALEGKGLTTKCIESGLTEIEERDYRRVLQEIIKKKADTVGYVNMFQKRYKIAQFAIGRGYEPELVWDIVRELLPD